MISKNKIVMVNFKYNKIICICKNLNFFDWMFKIWVRVIFLEGFLCVGFKGNILYGYDYLKKECGKDNSVKEWLYFV